MLLCAILGTLGSLVRFFFILIGYKLQHNDLQYEEIVRFLLYPKDSLFYERGLGGGGLILGLLFKISEYGLGSDDIKWT